LALGVEVLERAQERAVGAGFVDRDVAVAGHAFEAREDVGLGALGRRRRDRVREEWDRAVQQDAGRVPVLVLDDLAALGRRRVARDAGALEGEAVAPAREAVEAREVDGMVRYGLAQALHAGIAVRPRSLVPAAAEDPLALGDALRGRRDAGHGVLFGVHR